MFETLISTLHLLWAVVGLSGSPDIGTLSVAVALVSVALVLLTMLTVWGSHPAGSSAAHPRRAIDASAILAQSDPDAPGHPRPRAPGRAVPAA